MKILCLVGLHKHRDAHDHPDRKLGYHIVECARCDAALASECGTRWHTIENTRSAIARAAAKAGQRATH